MLTFFLLSFMLSRAPRVSAYLRERIPFLDWLYRRYGKL